MKGIIRVSVAWLCLCVAVSGCGGGGSTPSDSSNPPPNTIGEDASLADLRTSATDLDQVFQPSVFDYTGTVSHLDKTVTITAVSSDSAASITINGVAAVSGEPSDPIDLQVGANLVTVAVTAEDAVTTKTYSVSIDRGDAQDLATQVYLKAANTDSGDQFGAAVALAGDLMAIGAFLEDSAATGIDGDSFDNSAVNSGAVYIFGRDETGTWTQEAYLKASNTGTGDEFGYSIALSGDTLAVSAFREDSAATGINGDETDNSAIDSGAVYIFTRDATGIWTQQAYIKASNADSTDGFGSSLALSGDTLAVGAQMEDSAATGIDGNQTDNSVNGAGAAYVFTRDAAGIWTQQAYVKASNSGMDDEFGNALALSGDTLVVAAHNEPSKSTGIDGDQTNNSWAGTGAVYVFTRDPAGAWAQQAYIKASNTGNADGFGEAVVLSGDTLVVGAPFEDSAATGIDGVQGDNKSLNAGATYIFIRDAGGAWSQQAYVKASNTGVQDQFGQSLTLADDFLAVGALEDSVATAVNGDQADNSATNSGAVYLFERDLLGAWSQIAYIKASNTDPADEFGAALAFDGSSLLIGAKLEDSSAVGVFGDQSDNNAPDSGAAYIYE